MKGGVLFGVGRIYIDFIFTMPGWMVTFRQQQSLVNVRCLWLLSFPLLSQTTMFH